MARLVLEAIEAVLRLRGRIHRVGVHADPWKHFSSGGVEEAERACDEANRDLLAYVRPPDRMQIANLSRKELPVRRRARARVEEIHFDSPISSANPKNDRVQLRLYRAGNHADRVVVFHHPVYQQDWGPWESLLVDVMRRMPVAMMACPYHYDRTPPGWFSGEGLINPNPLRLFEGLRQWFADQKLAMRVLEEACALRPAAVVGFSLGAFQSMMAASAGHVDLPLVSIASTNRYGYGLLHGVLGPDLVRAMRKVGIDAERLLRMVDSLQLERYVPRLHGRPVLFVTGTYDRVDPPPSIQRLELALQPRRAVHVPAGHGTLLLFRRRISRAIVRFFKEEGVI